MSELDHYETRASLFERMNQHVEADRDLAWEEFRIRYAPIIARFATKCGATSADVDDIVQEVMTAFFTRSGEFVYDRSKGRFRSYLKTCTVRAAIRRAGSNLKFRGVPLDQVPEPEEVVEPAWNDAWEEQLVAQGLTLLRTSHGNSVTFKAFEEYVLRDRAAGDVAAELGITENSVHQAKSRTTKQLREIVTKLREAEA